MSEWYNRKKVSNDITTVCINCNTLFFKEKSNHILSGNEYCKTCLKAVLPLRELRLDRKTRQIKLIPDQEINNS